MDLGFGVFELKQCDAGAHRGGIDETPPVYTAGAAIRGAFTPSPTTPRGRHSGAAIMIVKPTPEGLCRAIKANEDTAPRRSFTSFNLGAETTMHVHGTPVCIIVSIRKRHFALNSIG